MQPKFHEFIKPGSAFPWMAKARIYAYFSTMLLVGSILSLAIKGLDLGIDFKGGTKVIVGFTEAAGATPDKVRDTISELIKSKTGGDAGAVDVQSFNVGDSDATGRKLVKYQVYTELTSLLTADKAKAVADKLASVVGKARIDRPEETDKFIVTLETPAAVNATKEMISKALAEVGFAHPEVLSDEERAYDMDFFKEYNLTLGERLKAGEKVADDDYEKAYADHTTKKTKALEKRVDRTYTVSLQQIQTDLEEALMKAFPKSADGQDNVVVESATAVSASVGADLFSKGMLALVYAIIGIMVYVGLRFDFRYGPGAVIALVHDAVITLGVFSVFGMKFSLPIVSAILTIIGYSINDTIVVYDRIRETQEKYKGLAFEKVIDLAINETLSRTILTSATTLMVAVALMVMGGGLISDFAFALTVGITIGTYSSIAMASPFTFWIDNWLTARQQRALGKGAQPTPST